MPSLRAILFRLHWALGLTAGLILALMGTTGALLSYDDTMIDWANRDRATVTERAAPRLGLEALVARIEEQLPGRKVGVLTVREEPASSVTVRFARDPLTRRRPVSAFADPYDGSIIGPVRWEEGFATIRHLHTWLLLPGDGAGWGRTITGFCAIAILIFLGTGIYLRWPKMHRASIWLQPRLSRPGRPRWWSLHAVVGTWLLPVYLIIALSGMTWSYGWFRDGVNRVLVGPETGEGRPPRMGRGEKTKDAPRPALDAAWTAFQAGDGREAGLVQVFLPEGNARQIRIRWLARGVDDPASRNEARYEAATGAPIATERAAQTPLGRRIAGNMLEVHRGRFFGSVFALVFCLAALAMPGFAATGITLYILRRRAAGRKKPSPARVAPAAAE